jgi:integrase
MLKIKYRTPKSGRKKINSLLTHNSFRIELSTGITIPDHIDFVQPKSFIGTDQAEIVRLQNELTEWENGIKNKYSSMVSSYGYGFSNQLFKSEIRVLPNSVSGDITNSNGTTLSAFIQQFSGLINSGVMYKKSNGKPYSNKTIELLKIIVNVINEFISMHGDFDFGMYNLDTESSIGKMVVIKAYDDLFDRYKSFLINDKMYGVYVVHDYIIRLGFIIRDRCDNNGINLSNRYMEKLKYNSPRERIVVALSKNQFEWILNNEQTMRNDFSNTTWGNQIIDYMIAGLLTAARIGDLNRLTINNLIKNDDGYVLSYVPHKTKNSSGVKVDIPVNDRLVKIFLRNAEKYNGKLLHTTHESTIDEASSHVKNILKRYDIFQNQVQTQNKYGDIETKPFWKAFKFHSTRASLITYLLEQGAQETVIKSISGHTLDSSSFKAYTDISNSMKIRAMQKISMIG